MEDEQRNLKPPEPTTPQESATELVKPDGIKTLRGLTKENAVFRNGLRATMETLEDDLRIVQRAIDESKGSSGSEAEIAELNYQLTQRDKLRAQKEVLTRLLEQ